MVLRSVGIAGAIVVGLAVASALTLLPAVLAILGTAHRRGSCDPARAAGDDASHEPTAAPGGGWPTWVMDHPVAVFVPTLAFLLVLGLPFLHVRLQRAGRLDPAARRAVAAGYDTLTGQFQEGEFAPLLLAVRTDGPVTDPANVGALYDWSRRSRPIRGWRAWTASWTSIRGSTGSSTSCSCRVPAGPRTGTWRSSCARPPMAT